MPTDAPESPAPRRAGPEVERIFGESTFGLDQMRARLPEDAFRLLTATVRAGAELDPSLADQVARAMKEWAEERGATHYSHWFQPLTGLTAEKHDSFLNPARQGSTQALTEFSGRELIRGEPSASSLPSGGLRTTFEARGYTAWDPTSPAFIVDGPGGATLCIPTAYSSWSGEALDQKIPLLRSLQAIEEQVARALALFGEAPGRTEVTLGPEQEFFLVDEEFFHRRPDLVTTGRTLFGARPPKGQELEDHYFGTIPDRVLAYMREVEVELYRLGVPVKTRHNEVAPGQFEMAFVYEDANRAADHQQLMMSQLRRIAPRHGLVCLLHEKPFAGVNGSGKHLNWSLAVDDRNVLEPGASPAEHLRFLFFCTAIVRAVFHHQDLLRASVAYAGNDHRLGANEAPPAIISVFLGDQLTAILEEIADAGVTPPPKSDGLLGLGVAALPPLPKHAGDRNRTSPFAFTGNKFEFRALGASQSISFPATVLNTIVAESLEVLRTGVEAELARGKGFEEALAAVLAREIQGARPIVFNGDGYSEAWVEEAERRGLLNLPTALEALPYLVKDKNAELFERYGVLTRRELESRFDILLHQYFHTVNIEGETVAEMGRTMFLPAALRHLNELLDTARKAKEAGIKTGAVTRMAREVAELCDELEEALASLREQNAELGGDEVASKVVHMHEHILPGIERVRRAVDKLEKVVPEGLWPVPGYREMLFLR